MPTPMRDHWRRLGMTLRGEWRTEYELGRKSNLKPWPFEFTHAAKNVLVEQFRQWGLWNRKNRSPEKDLGYDFPD